MDAEEHQQQQREDEAGRSSAQDEAQAHDAAPTDDEEGGPSPTEEDSKKEADGEDETTHDNDQDMDEHDSGMKQAMKTLSFLQDIIKYSPVKEDTLTQFFKECSIPESQHDELQEKLEAIWSRAQDVGMPLKFQNGEGWTLRMNSAGLTEIPDFVRFFKQLTRLDLVGNRITKLPSWLPELECLTQLNMCDNPMRTIEPWVTRLPNLEKLWLLGSENPLIPEPFLAMDKPELQAKSATYLRRYSKLMQLRLFCLSQRFDQVRAKASESSVEGAIHAQDASADELRQAALFVPDFIWLQVAKCMVV